MLEMCCGGLKRTNCCRIININGKGIGDKITHWARLWAYSSVNMTVRGVILMLFIIKA